MLWIFALAQTIHSLGLTLGSNYVVSSKNKKQISVMRDTVISVFVNTATVMVVGCVVFGTIGHICARWRQRIDSPFLHKDPGIIFVVYSEVIRNMPVPTFWAVIFFFFLICVAMDSQVTIASTGVQALEESYGRFIKQRFQGHGLFLLFICVACFITSIPYITQAVVVCGGMSLSRLRYRNKHHFPMWVDVVGWILFGIIVSVVPVFVVKALHKAESSGIIQKVREALEPQMDVDQPTDFWEPKPLVVINNPKNGVNHHASVLKSHRYKGYSKGDYEGETVI
ncbi:sodium/chloride dependent transporter, putative [Ixodes scapularis]|uniref:Sodium/chloride dependent transporter, putative n=1 Tax=Ixodes scapularis TaxID=6945 RepID=B7QHL3_IXOSC|nr:sodium/chloride dependent transporter, putative [Ixodes scapularis]|eukprot:XP_002414670.1 sodium/chloride dependent transporter, putative [Ixodes scapularis]